MSVSLDIWDEDLPPSPEEEYAALLRALRRTEGFGLLFVECSLAEGTRLVERVRKDLPQKSIDVLRFETALKDGNIFGQVQQHLHQTPVDVLFIQGLEHSLYDYEDTKRELGWRDKEIHSYSWKGVPPVMVNLNQQRENFRDSFHTCFVFLIPRFVMNYLIHRAPDFFDWRSGIFHLPMPEEQLQHATRLAYVEERNEEGFKNLSPQKRREKILHIQALLDEENLPTHEKADLLFEQALLFRFAGALEEAIASYNRALEFKPDYHEAWYSRGNALYALGRKEEAIAAYDRALAFKPDYHEAWYNRGNALSALGRNEEAIAAYDRALAVKPDLHEAWNNRGNALYALGRNEEAIAAYDRALAVKPDKHEAWYNRGTALSALGRYEEAIAAYDRALAFKPDDHEAWNNRGTALSDLGRNEEAIESHEEALHLRHNLQDKRAEIASLQTLSALYRETGQFRKSIQTATQLNQLLQESDLPLEELPYPKWLKTILKFSERGKVQMALCLVGGLIASPFILAYLIGRMIFLLIKSKFL